MYYALPTPLNQTVSSPKVVQRYTDSHHFHTIIAWGLGRGRILSQHGLHSRPEDRFHPQRHGGQVRLGALPRSWIVHGLRVTGHAVRVSGCGHGGGDGGSSARTAPDLGGDGGRTRVVTTWSMCLCGRLRNTCMSSVLHQEKKSPDRKWMEEHYLSSGTRPGKNNTDRKWMEGSIQIKKSILWN